MNGLDIKFSALNWLSPNLTGLLLVFARSTPDADAKKKTLNFNMIRNE